jgi:hypothetical protein
MTIACPKCGSSRLIIEVPRNITVQFTVVDDEEDFDIVDDDNDGDLCWDSESQAQCAVCGHQTEMKGFGDDC